MQSLTARPSIGGPGKAVVVDKDKIGHRKYHRGRIVDSIWILGMVELQTGAAGDHRQGGHVRMEVCENNKRDKAELLKLIKRHVLPGTTIMTDEWKAYSSVPQLGF